MSERNKSLTDFNVDIHAKETALRVLQAIFAYDEKRQILPPEGEVTGNSLSVLDAIQWLEKALERGDETLKKMQETIDEADRRAGAAERENARLQEDAIKRNQWLHQAKLDAGWDVHVSFDVVWEQALAALKREQVRPKFSPGSRVRLAHQPEGHIWTVYRIRNGGAWAEIGPNGILGVSVEHLIPVRDTEGANDPDPSVSRETLQVGDLVRHKPTGRRWTIVRLDEARGFAFLGDDGRWTIVQLDEARGFAFLDDDDGSRGGFPIDTLEKL